MYRRQMSAGFEDYVEKSIHEAEEDDLVIFKLYSCSDREQQYAEPLMFAIKRHFTEKRAEAGKAFTKFKRRNGGIIVANLFVVTVCNLLLPFIMSEEVAYETGIHHLLEVLWFVIFYHPLSELLFNWNYFVKRIELMNKLTNAEYIILNKEKKAKVVYD